MKRSERDKLSGTRAINFMFLLASVRTHAPARVFFVLCPARASSQCEEQTSRREEERERVDCELVVHANAQEPTDGVRK